MQAADHTAAHAHARADQEPARTSVPGAMTEPGARPVFVRPPRRSPVRRGLRRPGSVIAPGTRARELRALASDLGQGTVEYVGLLLLMASVLAAVVAASKSLGGNDKIGKQVVTQIGESIKMAGEPAK